MEKLEVGQVWRNGKTIRKVISIYGSYPMVEYELGLNGWVSFAQQEFTFIKWISRTGAKLEGSNGK